MTCQQPVHHHLQCHLSPTLHYTLTYVSLQLTISRSQYEYCSRLFQILDVDSTGLLRKERLESFVQKYCPCWNKRDSNLPTSIDEHLLLTTMGEAWDLLNNVGALSTSTHDNDEYMGCGLSGFLLFCRLAILIQYQEKYASTSYFCEDHNHQDSGEAVVMVQVPQQQHRHIPITLEDLQTLDESFENCIPPFELVFQPTYDKKQQNLLRSSVKVERFVGNDEYVIRCNNTTTSTDVNDNLVIVRRLMKDWKWLFRFYQQHGRPGGILCGRIVPSFSHNDSSAGNVVHQISKTVFGQDSSTANDPIMTTRKLERYINYMLEHPAFASSFALYTMLNSSPKGFDAAKVILKDIHHPSSSSSIASPIKENPRKGSESKNNILSLSSQYLFSSGVKKLSWVRTAAAQAAMAMKVHGILETTGYQTASAKLQHASLPNFVRNENDYNYDTMDDGEDEDTYFDEDSFEDGVVSISSELDTKNNSNIVSFSNPGFDLLPSPRPLSERSALCAGSYVYKTSPSLTMKKEDEKSTSKSRANYYDKHTCSSSVSSSQKKKNLFLGELAVENDIRRLYFLLAQVQSNMQRFQKILSTLSFVSQEQKNVVVSIWKGRWLGRENMVPNDLLFRGVEKLDIALEKSIGSYRQFVEDVSWHSTLAKAAVKASKNVHSTIVASYTAKRAKTVAESALQTELENKNCNDDVSNNKNISISRSQAIRAAVLEHEAMLAKRRATSAFTCDVKVWNVHRKCEIQKSCLDFIHAQIEGSRSAVSAWEDLRHGLLSSSLSQKDPIEIVGTIDATKAPPEKILSQQHVVGDFSNLVLSLDDIQEDDITEISNPLGIDDNEWKNYDNNNTPRESIVTSTKVNEADLGSEKDYFTHGSHHDDFTENDDDLFSLDGKQDDLASESMFINDSLHQTNNNKTKEQDQDNESDEDQLVRSPILIRDCNNVLSSSSSSLLITDDKNFNHATFTPNQKEVDVVQNETDDSFVTNNLSVLQEVPVIPKNDNEDKRIDQYASLSIAPIIADVVIEGVISDEPELEQKKNNNQENEINTECNTSYTTKADDNHSMTDSMQSLVDGLMTWGGGTPYPSTDDIFHLGDKTDSDSPKVSL